MPLFGVNECDEKGKIKRLLASGQIAPLLVFDIKTEQDYKEKTHRRV